MHHIIKFCLLITGLALFTTQNLFAEEVNLSVVSVPGGYIYLDGKYTGLQSPATLPVAKGKHSIAVGFMDEPAYLRKEIEVISSTQVALTRKDKVTPKVWRALFVGVPQVSGVNRDQKQCNTTFSESDLDLAFDFFKMNLRTHIERFSMGAIEWDIERRDLPESVALTYLPDNDWFTLEAEQSLALLPDVKAGEYDTIFFIWREEEQDCSFKSSYFGLAWLEPWSESTRKTGYVTVKFNSNNGGMANSLDWYRDNDPGVWTHEWLHVVLEKFYPKLAVATPIPPEGALILHAAQAYGYQYPWMNWYRDLISGQVPFGETFRGIGPEALMNCSIRDMAKGQCQFDEQ